MGNLTVGQLRYYVCDMRGAPSVAVYPMSDGEYRALQAKVSFEDIGLLHISFRDQAEADIFCADYISMIDRLNGRDLPELLALSE